MRRSWKDYWKPGEKDREAFDDMERIIQALQEQVDSLTLRVDTLETEVDALQALHP